MSDLTEQHIAVLRVLVDAARLADSDVGMDASVLAALLDERDSLRTALQSLMMACINGSYYPSPSWTDAWRLLGGYKAYPWLRKMRLPISADDEVQP